jgi:hypothetical protein
MRLVRTSKSVRPSVPSGRPSLNPYLLDDINPTLAEIRRARYDEPRDVR